MKQIRCCALFSPYLRRSLYGARRTITIAIRQCVIMEYCEQPPHHFTYTGECRPIRAIKDAHNGYIFSYVTAHKDYGTIPGFWKWFTVDQNWRAMFAAEAIPGIFFFAVPPSCRKPRVGYLKRNIRKKRCPCSNK